MVTVPPPLSVREVDAEAQMVTLTVYEGELELDNVPPPPPPAPIGVLVAPPGEEVEEREGVKVEGKDRVPVPPVGVPPIPPPPPTLPPPRLALTVKVVEWEGEVVWEAVEDGEAVDVKVTGVGELDRVTPPTIPPVPVGPPMLPLWVGEVVREADAQSVPVGLGEDTLLLVPPAAENVNDLLEPGVKVFDALKEGVGVPDRDTVKEAVLEEECVLEGERVGDAVELKDLAPLPLPHHHPGLPLEEGQGV